MGAMIDKKANFFGFAKKEVEPAPPKPLKGRQLGLVAVEMAIEAISEMWEQDNHECIEQIAKSLKNVSTAAMRGVKVRRDGGSLEQAVLAMQPEQG